MLGCCGIELSLEGTPFTGSMGDALTCLLTCFTICSTLKFAPAVQLSIWSWFAHIVAKCTFNIDAALQVLTIYSKCRNVSCKGQESNHLAPWSWPECVLCFCVFLLGQLRDFLEFCRQLSDTSVCLNHTWGHVAIRADIKQSRHKAPHYCSSYFFLFSLWLQLGKDRNGVLNHKLVYMSLTSARRHLLCLRLLK